MWRTWRQNYYEDGAFRKTHNCNFCIWLLKYELKNMLNKDGNWKLPVFKTFRRNYYRILLKNFTQVFIHHFNYQIRKTHCKFINWNHNCSTKYEWNIYSIFISTHAFISAKFLFFKIHFLHYLNEWYSMTSKYNIFWEIRDSATPTLKYLVCNTLCINNIPIYELINKLPWIDQKKITKINFIEEIVHKLCDKKYKIFLKLSLSYLPPLPFFPITFL